MCYFVTMAALTQKVSTTTAYFCITPDEAARVQPVRPNIELPLDEYPHPWPRTANVEVVLPVWEQDGWLYVTNVSVNTLPFDVETPYGTLRAPDVERLPMSTNIWRAIPLGALMTEAVEAAGEHWLPAQSPVDEADLTVNEGRSDTRPRRGRAPILTDGQLQRAVDAYKANPSRGVVAAQEALQRAGVSSNAPDGQVTREQAKKAIARARQLGLLEPGRKTRRRTP